MTDDPRGRPDLVEDEDPLRKLISTVLTAAGYDVLQAANGQEAIAAAHGRQRIDLLLTDVVTPGLSGPGVVVELRGNWPELVVLYMSGYDRELVGQAALGRTTSFLPKPFTPRSLLTAISELLGVQRHIGADAGRSKAS